MENKEYFDLSVLNESRHLFIDGKRYCAYCGEIMNLTYKKKEGNDRYYNYLICDCDDAQKEIAIKSELKKLYDELPKSKFEIQNIIAAKK